MGSEEIKDEQVKVDKSEKKSTPPAPPAARTEPPRQDRRGSGR